MNREIITEILRAWPRAELLGLDGDGAARYNRIQAAFQCYASGGTTMRAAALAQVSRTRFGEFIVRARTIVNGSYFGHRVGLSRQRLSSENKVRESLPSDEKKRKKSKAKGTSGVFKRFSRDHPDLVRIIDDLVIHGKAPGGKKIDGPIPDAIIYSIFVNASTNGGIRAPEFPFNSKKDRGERTVRRYIAKLRSAKASRLQASKDGFEKQYSRTTKDIDDVYSQVECDGYSLDVDYYIEIPGRIPGTVTRIPAKRIWIIAVVERVTQVVLGYSIALGDNYSSSDVLRAVRHCLVPWAKRDLDLPGVGYEEGEVFPSSIPGLDFVCFDEFHVDNAKANLSNLTLSTLENAVNAVPVFGPVSSPNYRASVEGLYSLLQKVAFDHWKNRKVLSLDRVEDAVDLLLAAHNNCRAEGYNCTRVELLRQLAASRGCELRRVSLDHRQTVLKHDLFDTVLVGVDDGKPLVRWQSARYYGACLNRTPSIVGKEAIAMTSASDPRVLELVLLETGEILGEVKIEKRWSYAAHSLATRSWANSDPEIKTLADRAADITRALLLYAARPAKSAPEARKKAVIGRAAKNNTLAPSDQPRQSDSPTRNRGKASVPADIDDFLANLGPV
ncbi:hypothetical protein [Variovorax sp. GT1P44]|uniref:hypothetical protein n=1 Tax=Variovorax sp. GT1P44 TaxID=3443742 RepID=UPI003F48D1CA